MRLHYCENTQTRGEAGRVKREEKLDEIVQQKKSRRKFLYFFLYLFLRISFATRFRTGDKNSFNGSKNSQKRKRQGVKKENEIFAGLQKARKGRKVNEKNYLKKKYRFDDENDKME